MNRNDRFTARAKTAIEKAQEAAEAMGHSYVGSEHLLLGILREGGGQGARVLNDNGLTDAAISARVEQTVGRGQPSAPPQGLSPGARRVIELAIGDAGRLGHGFVGTEHLLMGLLRASDCTAARILTDAGADLNKLYSDAVRLFAPQAHGIPPASGRDAATAAPPRPTVRRGETRTLDQFSRDLTELAAQGRLDPVIGRERELRRVMQILSRRSKNNPVLIGEPGVGKTAVAEALAQRLVSGDVPEALQGKRLAALDLTGMLAGTKYRGDFEERVRLVLKEVQRAGNILLFIDEVHTIVGTGAAEGAIDTANILKPALSRGEVQVLGATTPEEYRKHIEKDAALERRFQPVTVGEPTAEESVEILRGLRGRYEAHHGVRIPDAAIEAAVRLSVRYLADRFLPDKAVDLIDEACAAVRMERRQPAGELEEARARVASLRAEKDAAAAAQDYELAATLRDREQAEQRTLEALLAQYACGADGRRLSVGPEDVAAVLSAWTGIPATRLTQDEKERLLQMEEILHRRVVGQDAAVEAVARAVRRSRTQLRDPKRPAASFLFLGPTGVGKTELCRALAEAVFGDERAMIRLDMSECMEKHAASRLIGAPPGYVGHEEGGWLIEKVRRRPYSVVLFDELEKAHPDVLQLMLQIMDEGRLTDSLGRRADFKNCILVMTGNVGARFLSEDRPPLGFGGGETERESEARRQAEAELKRTFRPEFLGRVDETIWFRRLTQDNAKEIARRMLDAAAARCAAAGVTLTYGDAAVEALAARGFDAASGARPLRRVIRTLVEDPAAELLLSGALVPGDKAELAVRDGEIVLDKTGA